MIPDNGPLARSISDFPDDDVVHFCTMHGPLHYSFCIYCPDFTGKEALGNRQGRKPSHCNHSRGEQVGRIEEGRLCFDDQSDVDKRINEDLRADVHPERRIRMPIDANDIKSAYSTDLPVWDFLRHSYSFCFRCGPESTTGIQFRCKHCGDRSICGTCAGGLTDTVSIDGMRTISFNCPECYAENTFTEKADSPFWSHYSDKVPERRLKWIDTRFVPVLYDWLDQLRRADALTSIDSEDGGRPSSQAKSYTLEEGWLSGRYWLDSVKREAWLDRPNASWKDHLFARVPHGVALTSFDYDLVLSYRTVDLEIARAVRNKLNTAGYSVFLMEAGRNIWDGLWPWRFAQAATRARVFAILATPAFFEGEATKAEIAEFEAQLLVRRYLAPESDWRLFALQPETGATELFEGIPATMHATTADEISVFLSSATYDLDSLFAPHVISVMPDVTNQSLSLCPRCFGPVYFSDDAVNQSIDQLDALARQGVRLGLTCVHGHRFCSGCDARQFDGGSLHTCPQCFENLTGREHRGVAGRRTPRGLYYSGVSTQSTYASYDPDNPTCLHCENLVFDGQATGKACYFGHRFCSACEGPASDQCPVCINEDANRVSLGTGLGLSDYFYGGTSKT